MLVVQAVAEHLEEVYQGLHHMAGETQLPGCSLQEGVQRFVRTGQSCGVFSFLKSWFWFSEDSFLMRRHLFMDGGMTTERDAALPSYAGGYSPFGSCCSLSAHETVPALL